MDGPDLVKAVAAQNPTSNIAFVLDKVNEILNQRIVDGLKQRTFDTVFHLVEAIGPDENITQVLGLVSASADFPKGLREDAQRLLDSGLGDSFCEYLKPMKKKGCWWF